MLMKKIKNLPNVLDYDLKDHLYKTPSQLA